MLDREVTLIYTSEVTLTGGKKNEMQGKVTKKSKLKVLLIGDSKTYTEAKLKVDPYFIAKPRPWGIRLENGLVEHKTETYVEFIVKEYLMSEYYLDNEQIDVAKIIGLKESKKSDDIDFRCVKISNILSIK